MNRGTGTFRFVLLACLLGVARTAWAFWPFTAEEEVQAEKLVSQGNTQLQAADEIWRAGNTAKAAELYQGAADTYQQAEKLRPNLQNGLVRFRISYCASQVAQILNATREKAEVESRVTVTHPPGLSRGAAAAPDEAARAAELSPEDLQRELTTAQKLVMGDHPEEALPPLVRVLRAEPANRRALLLMAALRVQQGRYDDAIVTVESLREADESEAVLLLASGAYCGAGRFFDALLALDKAIKKNPDSPQAHLNMAYLLLEMSPEKRADADAYYKRALKLGVPRDALLEKRLGR